MKKRKKYEKDLFDLLYLTIAVLILLLSIFNLQSTSLNKAKVLGIKTEQNEIKLNKEISFWEEFQANNPTYIDGWVELGRFDKVREINPNYLIK